MSQFNKSKSATPKIIKDKKIEKDKQANISRIPSPILPRPSKSILTKFKYYKKSQSSNSKTKSFTQATKGNLEDILKIKDAFPKLLSSKIIKLHNVTNNSRVKGKSKLNMTTKGLFRKQVIILINEDNSRKIVSWANIHVSNINKLLKEVKSVISADFIQCNNKVIIITTNKTTANSYLKVVEDYIKYLNNINSNEVMSLWLCQVRFTPGWKSAEWTRRWVDLWNDLGFSLCAAPSVCCVVDTSDEWEKVRVEVSTDWCVAIEHRRSSSMRVYLCWLSD